MRWPTTLVALVSASFFAGTSSNAQHCERPVVRVSDAANGEQGNLNSFRGDASSKGRYVAFESVASNLLSGDDNDEHDVFWRNMETAELRLLSINLVGEFANYRSRSVSLNCDGTIAEFTSLSSDLVEGDTNERRDIFVRDIQNEITQRVSVSSAGVQSNGSSDAARISGGGHHVAFASWGSNLVPDDTNNLRDAFVHDLLTGVTTRISVSTHGEQGNLYSYNPSLSFDGHYVAFESIATNLIPGDTNSAPDIFMHDRETGETTRVSVSAEGEQGNGWSRRPAISVDGAFVTFESN
ncbi:MAG: calcium-binding protein, partial [Planctomycetes bacterium]|nr:calcium-binding protein [Planctomycetota bacterium]